MLALLGISVGILIIGAACASVKPPPRHYETCTVFRVKAVWQTGRELYFAKVIDEKELPTWLVFHEEVHEGDVIQYTPYSEEGDTLVHAQIHSVRKGH